ncbi:anti-sigma factor family protein [Nocardiopsis salina]|uniref:anti-sigma factor family protein n=1 Tax=Nocardiopsis salina TaxID=245836 RepID=UPI00034982F8|nr:zf-HC2 domain-containing protein [Nocardiopsis salina]
MSSEHLGERLSALVDGELGPAEHESALIHLAKCEACRFEADMTRRLKRRLHGLGEPEPDLDFMGRLSSLDGGPGQDGPNPFDPPFGGGGGFGSSPPLGSSRPLGGFPGAPGGLGGEPLAASGPEADPTATPGARAPGTEATGERERADRGGSELLSQLLTPFAGGRYAVAGAAVVTALLGTAFVAGGEAEDAPVVEPRLADYAVEHAVTSRHIPVETSPEGYEPPPGSEVEQAGR